MTQAFNERVIHSWLRRAELTLHWSGKRQTHRSLTFATSGGKQRRRRWDLFLKWFYFEEGVCVHKFFGGCQRKRDGVLKQTQENHNKYLLLTPSSPQIDLWSIGSQLGGKQQSLFNHVSCLQLLHPPPPPPCLPLCSQCLHLLGLKSLTTGPSSWRHLWQHETVRTGSSCPPPSWGSCF